MLRYSTHTTTTITVYSTCNTTTLCVCQSVDARGFRCGGFLGAKSSSQEQRAPCDYVIRANAVHEAPLPAFESPHVKEASVTCFSYHLLSTFHLLEFC